MGVGEVEWPVDVGSGRREVGAGAGVGGAGPREVVYQLEPTLRVHMPGQRALGAKHVDYSYKRQPTELNVWLPLTPVGEGNTLWAESTPGTFIGLKFYKFISL